MSRRGAPPEAALVQVRRVLDAPADRIYRAWTEPELLQRWFRPRGGSSAGAEMDVRVGGRYRWGMKLLGHVYYAHGEYLEIERNRRLVFTFGWERVPFVRVTDSVVTVEFHDRNGQTEVVITHERLASRSLRLLHREGWERCLDFLGRLPWPRDAGVVRT
jgi:uncharacterized protein YndB with AHSA1/START domain